MTAQINLGDKVRCKVTDFEGIAWSRIEYLNGCIQIGVKPKVDKDGKLQDAVYIDIEQIEVVKKDAATINARRSGGDFTSGPRK